MPFDLKAEQLLNLKAVGSDEKKPRLEQKI
jgi:hypothetical protein